MPLAIPKYQPRLPDFLADTKPPMNEANPCTPNTQGIMLASLSEDPISIMDNTIAPKASAIPDQNNPDATGDAVRTPNKRDIEFKDTTPSSYHSFVSAYGA